MKKYEGIYISRQYNRNYISGEEIWEPTIGPDGETPAFGCGRTDNFSKRHYQHNQFSSKQKGIKVEFERKMYFDYKKYFSILSKNKNAIETIFHDKILDIGYKREGREVFYGRSKKHITGVCSVGDVLEEDFFLRLGYYLFNENTSQDEITPFWYQEFDINSTINNLLNGDWVVQKQDTGYGKSTLIVLIIKKMFEQGIEDSQCIISTVPSTFSAIYKSFYELFYFRNKFFNGDIELITMNDIVEGKVKFKPKGQIVLGSKQFFDGYTKYLKLIRLENKQYLGIITQDESKEIEYLNSYRKFETLKSKIDFKYVHFDEPHNATNTQHSENMMSLFPNASFDFLSTTSEKVELKYKDRIKLKNPFENSVYFSFKHWLENMCDDNPFDDNYNNFIDEWTQDENNRSEKDYFIRNRIDYFIKNKEEEIEKALYRIVEVVFLTNNIKNRKEYAEELIKRDILTSHGFNIEKIYFDENLDLLKTMISNIFNDKRVGGDGIVTGIKKSSTLSIISKFNKDNNIKKDPIDIKDKLTILIKVHYSSNYENENGEISDMRLNPNINRVYGCMKELGLLQRFIILKVQTDGVCINDEEVQSLNSSKLKEKIEEIYEQTISEGKNLIILEGSKLDTGIDLPNINLNFLINLSNISSYIVIRQFIGRGKRASKGKNFVFYLDFNIESRLVMDFITRSSNSKYLKSDDISTYLRHLNIIDYNNDQYFEYKNDENRLKKLELKIREEIEKVFEDVGVESFKRLNSNDGFIESYDIFYDDEHKGFSIKEEGDKDSIKGKSKTKIDIPEKEKKKIEETLKKLEKIKVVHLIFHYYINELVHDKIFYSFFELLEYVKYDDIFREVFTEILIKLGVDEKYVETIDISKIIEEIDGTDSKLDGKLFYYNNSDINV